MLKYFQIDSWHKPFNKKRGQQYFFHKVFSDSTPFTVKIMALWEIIWVIKCLIWKSFDFCNFLHFLNSPLLLRTASWSISSFVRKGEKQTFSLPSNGSDNYSWLNYWAVNGYRCFQAKVGFRVTSKPFKTSWEFSVRLNKATLILITMILKCWSCYSLDTNMLVKSSSAAPWGAVAALCPFVTEHSRNANDICVYAHCSLA